MTPEIIAKILDQVQKAHDDALHFENIFSQDIAPGKNECLMFIKPEILVKSSNLKTKQILELIFDKIEKSGLTIHDIKMVGGKYLEKYDIIAQHYGVINKIANDAKGSLAQSAREKFTEIFSKNVNEEKVLGGFEFLKAYPEFTPYTLDILYQAKTSKKLAGGTYVVDTKVDDEIVYLINGFHPRQIHHFTQSGRSIIVLTLSGDQSWEKIRDEFIGNTFPDRAVEGSIRRELLDRKDEFGLPDVSIANNGVHLSAGPVEGLIELVRYNSDFSNPAKVKSYKDYSFGKKLAENFSAESIEKILANENVSHEGKQVSVFDLTELKNSDEAIELLKKYFN